MEKKLFFALNVELKMNEIEIFKKALKRERLARKEGEQILEVKSLELYNTNIKLKELNNHLKIDVSKKEKDLIKTETRFNDLIATASDIIFKADLNGNYKYINQIAADLTGFPLFKFLENNFLFLIRDDYREILSNHFQKQLDQKERVSYIEYPIISVKGEEIWLGQSTNLIFENNKPFEFFALARNISDRKKAEIDSRFSRIRLEAMLNNLNSGILVEDKFRKISMVNQRFCDMFSLPVKAKDIIGLDCSKSADEVKSLVTDSKKFINRINLILKNRKIALSEEVEMKNGTFLERDYMTL